MEKVEYVQKDNNNKNNGNKAFTAVLLLIILCLLVLSSYLYFNKSENIKTITKDRTISETKVTEESIESAIAKVYDSVLYVEVLNNNGEALSSGTGFVYGKDDKYGYVLTNAHVVSTGTNVKGKLTNDKEVNLEILGTDTYTDLAVLRMDAKDVLQVASIGKSSNIKVGNTVFTVGSPMGKEYSGTVTKGILSGKDRLIESSTSNLQNNESYIVKVLQTDAAISPGNSGGPLVDLAGDVIGINSLKLIDEKVEGMGFAIPIEDAMNYVDILEKGEAIKRPIIGVQIIDMTNEYLLYRYGIRKTSDINDGIILVKVNDNYPAAQAGLKDGDIITKVNDNKVSTTAQFKYELYKYNIGDTITITYYRNNKEETAKIKLDKYE